VDFKTHDLERYDYPGGYKEKKHGDHFSIADDAGSYATFTRRSAHGHAPSLFAGTLTDVGTHPVGAENLKYLVTRATHHFARQQYRSRLDGGDGSEHYRGQYQLHAAYLPFKTQDHTPYARVHGPQTGKVVARDEKVPKNEEIDVDEQGRIFVEFFWDRKKTPSIPVRVAQVWAGAEFGAMFTPRIGMEVVVDFLEGDPDRPLVTGCVYNDTNKNPLKLPAEKNNTGWKSNSTLGGNGYNIIGFVDTKNEEALYQRAERDHYTYARYREIHNIAETYDGKTDGKNSYIVTVKHGNEKHHVDDGNRETKISENDVETIGGNQTIKVGGNLSITAGTNGPGSKITIKIGQSTITMDDTSITLKSPQITLESMNTDIKADAIITINGKALVKIN
jgi:type VI secretion system secreted protein VgrG